MRKDTTPHDPNIGQALKPLQVDKPRAPRVTSVMPAPSPTAQLLMGLDAESVIANLVPELADQIVSEWRQAREAPGIAKAREKSTRQYEYIYRMLEKKYTEENNLEDVAQLNPIELVKRFFFHAKKLSAATWKLYRQSLLHMLNERALGLSQAGLPHQSQVIALAALVTISKQPYQSKKKDDGNARNKTIKSKYFDQLITHLATGYIQRNMMAKYAHSFALATIATGLRPAEWLSVDLRPARQDEMPDARPADGWLAIHVLTAKRKEDEPDWPRTLLIEPGIHQIHIRQHYQWFMQAIEKSKDPDVPEKVYINRCSSMLKRACKELWPYKPERWITLYSLRSQARANIASVHGNYVAAGMLGHSLEKGQRYYAGSTRNNLSRSSARVQFQTPVALPGPDCLAKAAEFQQREAQRITNREDPTSESPGLHSATSPGA